MRMSADHLSTYRCVSIQMSSHIFYLKLQLMLTAFLRALGQDNLVTARNVVPNLTDLER